MLELLYMRLILSFGQGLSRMFTVMAMLSIAIGAPGPLQ